MPPLKSGPQDEHFGQDDACREKITSSVELASDHLLWRHVAELAFELTGVGAPLDLGGAGDAEVGELHRARAIDEDVAGGDVAVHEAQRLAVVVARRVGVLERAQHRQRDVEADVEQDVVAPGGRRADQAGPRRAVDVLHRHVEFAVLLSEVEDLDDVRVAEVGADARLVDEHRDEVGIARVLGKDAFDGDDFLEAVRALAAREVHLRHPARRDPPEQLVGPQAHRRRDAGDRHR